MLQTILDYDQLVSSDQGVEKSALLMKVTFDERVEGHLIVKVNQVKSTRTVLLCLLQSANRAAPLRLYVRSAYNWVFMV